MVARIVKYVKSPRQQTLTSTSALLLQVTPTVVAHNHPSGNLTPSQADLDVTAKLKDSAKLLSIVLRDHIIITKEAHSSII